MDSLNYHHLHYFWVVAREGGLVRAGKVLRLSHPTLSAQVRALEERLGQQLFHRAGRGLVLTDAGRVAYRYAEQIFSLGREMTDELAAAGRSRPLRFVVGIVDEVPKMVARRLLAPALRLADPVQLCCQQGRLEPLLADLALHRVDLVLSDSPLPPHGAVRAFSHPLGHSGVGLFATPALAERHGGDFPRSLDGAPLLLPLPGTPLGQSLRAWIEAGNLRPEVRAEVSDSGLMKVLGSDGMGLFPAPLAVQREVCRQFGVVKVGEVPGLRERFYAISSERRLRHPPVVAVIEAARQRLFAKGAAGGAR